MAMSASPSPASCTIASWLPGSAGSPKVHLAITQCDGRADGARRPIDDRVGVKQNVAAGIGEKARGGSILAPDRDLPLIPRRVEDDAAVQQVMRRNPKGRPR